MKNYDEICETLFECFPQVQAIAADAACCYACMFMVVPSKTANRWVGGLVGRTPAFTCELPPWDKSLRVRGTKAQTDGLTSYSVKPDSILGLYLISEGPFKDFFAASCEASVEYRGITVVGSDKLYASIAHAIDSLHRAVVPEKVWFE